MNFKEAKGRRDAALEEYRSKAADLTSAETAVYTERIKALHQAVSDAITEGANPCPFCGEAPHGLEQPTSKSHEFEIGCIPCKPFRHTDGTVRKVCVRGGMLPRHAVEAWNEGPDQFMVGDESLLPATPTSAAST